MTFSGEVTVENITLDGVRGLRTMLSATVHDVLYYMSPIYCQEIIDSVTIYDFFPYTSSLSQFFSHRIPMSAFSFLFALLS